MKAILSQGLPLSTQFPDFSTLSDGAGIFSSYAHARVSWVSFRGYFAQWKLRVGAYETPSYVPGHYLGLHCVTDTTLTLSMGL